MSLLSLRGAATLSGSQIVSSRARNYEGEQSDDCLFLALALSASSALVQAGTFYGCSPKRQPT